MNPRASMPSTRSILVVDVVLGQRVDEAGKAKLVFEQRGDVVKQNAGFGEVGNFADELLEVVAVVRLCGMAYQAPSMRNDCDSSNGAA